MRGELAGAFGAIVSDPGELTKKERFILRCAAYGMTNEQTAATVERTAQTVKFHRTNIISKLGASNMTHAVALAYEDGILGARHETLSPRRPSELAERTESGSECRIAPTLTHLGATANRSRSPLG